MSINQECRKVLNEYLQKWPLEKLKSLTIEEYAGGNENNKDTLSYWWEKQTSNLGGVGGMGGGGSFKYGVYFMIKAKDHSTHKTYNSDGRYAWRRELGDTPEEAFLSMKSTIIEIAEAAQDKNFKKIDSIDFPYNPLKWKIAFLYSNESLLINYQLSSLQFSARKLGMKNSEDATTSELYEYILNQKPKSETVYDFSNKLWTIYQEEKDINYYVLGSKYGEDGDYDVFQLFLEKSVIATKFFGNKSLEDFYLKPKSEIIDYLKNQGEVSKSYSALKHFLNIKVGDKVAVKSDGSPKGDKGYLEIVGFAEVIERDGVVYQFDKELGHTLSVKYIEAPNSLKLELGGYGRTVHHLSNPNHIQEIFENSDYKDTKKSIQKRNVIEANKEDDNIQKPTTMHALNQILYGPPGTGKTYRTRQIAYEIIKGHSLDWKEEENNKVAIQLFKELKGEQIEFVTFHQNYSYEDFVQGLRPNTEDNQGLSFKLHNGIFYKIAKRAKENYLKSINSTKEIEVSFEDVFDELCKPLENDEEVAIQMKQAVFHITNIDGNRIEFRKQSGGTGHVLLIPVLKSLYLETTKYSKAGLGVYYNPLVDELRRVADELKSNIQPEPLKNYVLIIDEINRANISRVFGELITLLEPSKRFGQDEELEVQLPSGDRFVVPPNLYVIGTMNTADKSIALLDIALRRRFDFVPVFPDMKWVDDKYRSFFDALNTKIAEMKSPDFTIGHSYFMEINGEEGIEKVMNNKVIPLLSEYFMNDLERVKSLLASVGVKIKTEHYGILRFESIDLSKTQKNGND